MNVSQRIPFFHRIVYNKYGFFSSSYLNREYILFKIIIKKNKYISFSDILFTTNLFRDYNSFNFVSYHEKWGKKLLYIKEFLKNEQFNDADFFLGIGELAYNVSKFVNYSQLTIGLSYKRFFYDFTFFDLYNPCNVKIGPIVNSIAEYIKYQFFILNYDKILSEMLLLFDMKLTDADFIFLIARLYFPTFYFDILKENNTETIRIIDRVELYLDNLKSFIIETKKRNYNIPCIDYLINQL